MPLFPNLPLREVLALPPFQGCRVLAGEATLDRPVSSVNLTDLTDYADWLSPGDLLVTTCFSIKEDQAAQQAFIPTLAEHGLAGVCIKPHRFLDEIPDFMITAAQERGFPLIELPMRAQFREISWAVFEAIRTRGGSAALQIERPSLLDFLRHLCFDVIADEKEESARAEALGLTLELPFSAARLCILTAEGTVPTATQSFFLYRSLLSSPGAAGLIQAAAVDTDQLLLILSGGETRQLLPALEAMAAGHPSLRLVLGQSRPGSGSAGMRRCLREARDTLLRLLAAPPAPVRCACFSELGLDRLLYAADPRAEAVRLSEDLLGPLRTEPDKYGELLATLQCYFSCLGNLKQVSETMHTHYNTVSYRLRQIQALTGRDLRDPDDRFLLELALRLYSSGGE